jgi:hypothetical protein
MNIDCFEIHFQVSFLESKIRMTQMHSKLGYFQQIFFSAGFLPLLSQNGGRTAAKFSRPRTFFFGRF